jgi:geranylgeranyl transferase type-1 subunit beta
MEEPNNKFEKEKHVLFLKYAFSSLKSYTAMDVHKITILYFVVGSLKILQNLSEEEKELSVRFVLNNSVIKDGKIIGFRGGSFTGWSFNKNYTEWNSEDKPHLAATYCGLCVLHMCGYTTVDKINLKIKELFEKKLIPEMLLDETIFEEITKSQNCNGNINAQSFDTENDARIFFCAMAIFKLLGKSPQEIKKFINYQNGLEYLNSIYNYEGGFSMIEGGESNAGITFCSIASYNILNAPVPNKDQVLFWLNSRNCTLGVNGRTNKVPDSCYSFWVMGSLSILNNLNLFDNENTISFLLNCQTCKVFLN